MKNKEPKPDPRDEVNQRQILGVIQPVEAFDIGEKYGYEKGKRDGAEMCVEHAAKWIQKMLDEGIEWEVIQRATTLLLFENAMNQPKGSPTSQNEGV